MHQNCCSEMLACDQEQSSLNDACMKTIPCTQQCSGKSGDDANSCIQDCASKVSPASQAFAAFLNCQQQNCNKN
jgi:hypothetical protein